jgi:hypothetical protein
MATDGGKIDISGVAEGLDLQAMDNELVVLANNGIWTISGSGDEAFTATSQSIRRVSEVGSVGKNTSVRADGVVFYWSLGGIYSLSRDEVSTRLSAANITEKTIQTYYLDIPEAGKKFSRGFYDESQKKVYWLYNDTSSYDGVNWRYQYNRALILDLNLQAFYSYSFDTTSSVPWIAAMIQKKAGGQDSVSEDVTDGGVDVTNGGETVTTMVTSDTISDVKLKFLTFAETSTDTYQYTLSEFNSERFLDWYTFDTTGTNYESYIETGHDIMEDLISQKEANTVYTFFKRTEQNVEQDGNGDLSYDKPSSCMMRAKWDWTDSSGSGRWTDLQQVYRFNNFLALTDGPLDYGYEVIQTINQVRGKGRALSLRFQSEQGKDFHLLGWSIPYTVITGA